MDSKRRALLGKSAAAYGVAIMAALKPGYSSAAMSRAAGPFQVNAGESRDGAALEIDGQQFESVKISGHDVDGRLCALVLTTPPDRSPPLHLHVAQNEWFFMLDGSIGVQCGEQRTVLRTGDSFLAPLGVPHAYVPLNGKAARILNVFDPAGEIEQFFTDYANVLNTPGHPDFHRLQVLSEQHGIKVLGPPLKAESFTGA